MTTTINIEIDSDAAGIFTKAPLEDRNRLCVLWGVLLREYRETPLSLRTLMDNIGSRAESRGLTPEKLESILHAV